MPEPSRSSVGETSLAIPHARGSVQGDVALSHYLGFRSFSTVQSAFIFSFDSVVFIWPLLNCLTFVAAVISG